MTPDAAAYLRVKNWSRFQHYAKRRPPWIKLYNNLIGDGDDFEHLGEMEQWQLVRIWMMASKSSRFTVDEDGTVVPAIPNDEQSIRRSIQTLKKVPLAAFIKDGWLIVVAESALCPPDASALLAIEAEFGEKPGQDASALLESEVESLREKEKPDQVFLDLLGAERFHSFGKLLRITTGKDDGSPRVIATLCKKLPVSEIEDVRAAYAGKGSVPVGKVVVALKDRIVQYKTHLEEVA